MDGWMGLLTIPQRLLDLFLRVHDERAVLHYRLVNGLGGGLANCRSRDE
jgi:hypothetical protein